MKIEVLHNRDPDYPCDIGIWVDGVYVGEGHNLVTVDPGAGWDRELWDEAKKSALSGDMSPAFRKAVADCYTSADSSPYIDPVRTP